MYTEILQRSGDEAGVRGWAEALKSVQMSGTEVARGFVTSPEFLSKSITEEEYVRIMYKAFFNLPAGDAEVEAWLTYMNNGMTRDEVFAGFANSAEFGTLCKAYGITQGNV